MTNNNEPPRRASDTYIPIGFLVTLIAVVGGLLTIYVTIQQLFVPQENRLTKLEQSLEDVDRLQIQLDKLEERIRSLEKNP
jgi:Tfp pilus assembly protein PilN